MSRISILGAGAWGIAVTSLLSENGHQIILWEPDPERAGHLHTDREDLARLPNVVIPYDTQIVSRLDKAISSTEIIALALPSHSVRPVAREMVKLNVKSEVILNLAKGIENDSLCRMSEVLQQELSNNLHDRICTLSGPSFAVEVAHKISTTVVVAGFKEEITKRVQSAFMNQYFRVYTSSDIIGIELGGSLKNVIAIASGICDGLGMGDNTRGALITRGLAEMIRLGERLGAQARTLAGLSGMGDLIATCTSRHSRNRFVGEEIAKGRKLNEVLESMVMVAEGVKTTESAYQLAQKHNVEMPITEQVYKILFEGKDSKQAVKDLMTREAKPEVWS
jgi:glycerol-3-phosphate dehydrogenase (NAD(P)+)